MRVFLRIIEQLSDELPQMDVVAVGWRIVDTVCRVVETLLPINLLLLNTVITYSKISIILCVLL